VAAKRSNELWLMAAHSGDGEYKRAVQQAVLNIPLRNEQGAVQHITFPQIADQEAGASGITLRAVSDAGVPVSRGARLCGHEVNPLQTCLFNDS